jgi:hypothetical protein
MAAIPFLSIHRIPPFKWHDRSYVAASGWLFDTVNILKNTTHHINMSVLDKVVLIRLLEYAACVLRGY